MKRSAGLEIRDFDALSLQCFVRVCEAGSLTRAAHGLGLAQPALSRRIAALEREAAGALFHRTGRGVVPTELGVFLLPRAQALLAQTQQLREDLRTHRGVPSGTVRLGVLPSSARPMVALLFERLSQTYPGIALQVVEGYSAQIAEALASGRVDIGVMSRYGPQAGPGEEVLAVVDSLLIGPAGDVRFTRPSVALRELATLPLVLPARPNGLRVAMDQYAARRGLRIEAAVEVDSAGVTRDLIVSCGLFTVLPYQAMFDDIAQGRVGAVRLGAPGIERSLCMGITTQRPTSQAVRVLAQELRQIVDKLVRRGVWRARAARR